MLFSQLLVKDVIEVASALIWIATLASVMNIMVIVSIAVGLCVDGK